MNQSEGQKKVTFQKGGVGCFGHVHVIVDGAGKNVKFDPGIPSEDRTRWKEAVHFGTSFVWEAIGRRQRNVLIKELEWNPVDTTQSVLAFCSAWALLDALGYDPEKFVRFDETLVRFCFRK